jgi:hypothetical protein
MRAVEPPRAAFTRRALIAGGIAMGAGLAVGPWRRSAGSPSAAPAAAGAAAAAPAGPGDPSGPAMVRRAEWGADESRRRAIDFDPVVEKLVVHHTGIDDGTGDWIRQVRDIYEFETASGYRDIAYHFLVDPNGTIYEGRWARDVPAGTRPDGQDARGWSVRGGHARGHNPRTIGIALLGDYTSATPTDAALAALVSLLGWKARRWQIDPEGESSYVLASGEAQRFPNIVAHGQIRATECPGPNLDRLLPDLRARTRAALAGGPQPTSDS